MKYTLEDFKHKKIAVWVRNEKEYRKFCIFARDLKWNGGKDVYKLSPDLPCEIAVGFNNSCCGMSQSVDRGYHSNASLSEYQSVTVDELDLEMEVKNEESTLEREICDSLGKFVIKTLSKENPATLELSITLETIKQLWK